MPNVNEVDRDVVDEGPIREQVGAVIREVGLSDAGRQLRMCQETLLRLSGGAGVRRGTLLVARAALRARAAREGLHMNGVSNG